MDIGNWTEVTSNGDTVWVNDGVKCVGRFCKYSGEVLHPGEERFWLTGNIFTNRTEPMDWSMWCDQMRVLYKVNIPERLTPGYIKEQM